MYLAREKKRKKAKYNFVVFVIVILALAVTLNVFFIRSFENRLQTEIDSLKAQLEQKQQENDNLKTENEKLNTDLDDYKARVDRLNGVAVPHPPEKTVYLTIDDGPSSHTEPILDILKKYNVKATFFVIGHNTDNAKRLYKKIIDEGHALGNHTYSHNYGQIYKSVDAFMEDVYKLDKFIYEITGTKMTVVRYPGGSSNRLTNLARIKSIAKRLLSEGYQYFDWNVDSQDGTRNPPAAEVMTKKIVDQVKRTKTSIVLMHDLGSKKSTVEALPKIIEQLSALGYKFGTLNEKSYYVHHR